MQNASVCTCPGQTIVATTTSTVCSNPEMAESIEWLHCRMNDLTIAVRLPAGAVFLHFTTSSAGLEPIQSMGTGTAFLGDNAAGE